MAAIAGYQSTIKEGGTPTTFTGEATTNLDPGTYKQYQITDATKRAFDPLTAPTVKKNGVAQSAALYTVDYLFGIITFGSALLNTDVVTVDGKYIPLAAIATARELSYEIQSTLLDSTVFGASERTRLYGIAEASGTIGALEALQDVIAGSDTLLSLLNARTKVLLECYLGQGQKLRAWATLDQESVKTAVSDLVNASINWKSTVNNGVAGFSLGT